MRTTLDIDDDVLEAAKELAKAERKTAGKVISELARKALTSPREDVEEAGPRGLVLKNEFYVLPRRGGPLATPELVERLLLEADLEDAGIVKDD